MLSLQIFLLRRFLIFKRYKGKINHNCLEVISPNIPPYIHLEKRLESKSSIICQAEKLNRAFINIFNNAFKAIIDNGIIFVHSYDYDERVWIEIEDNGHGFDSESHQNAFEPFFSTWQREGLGLFMVKTFVKLFKGEIEIQKSSIGGAKIIMCFPAKEIMAPSPN